MVAGLRFAAVAEKPVTAAMWVLLVLDASTRLLLLHAVTALTGMHASATMLCLPAAACCRVAEPSTAACRVWASLIEGVQPGRAGM